MSRKNKHRRAVPATIIQKGEGEYRPGPWPVINPDGILPNEWGQWMNYWQMGYDPLPVGHSAVVEACVSAYAQTIAMCPGDHWRGLANGGRERVKNSALSRLLRWPNDYQSRSDFILGLVRNLYLDGNHYSWAQRNQRFEVANLHPFDPRQSRPHIAAGGEIIYQLGGNPIVESEIFGQPGPFAEHGLTPARDVLHIKLEVKPDNPLIGIPPLKHAAVAVGVQRAIGSQLLGFFTNMSRPSGVLRTELNLSKVQVDEMRNRWNEQAKGLNAGGVPILTNGLQFQAIGASAKDAELAAALKLSQDEVFMVYGVPPAILGLADRSTFSSTEALMNFWLARGLGFAINHIEVAFDQFFGLAGWPDEYVELDTRALLRQEYRQRIEALARGVQGGIYSPDEARNSEDLPKVKDGFGEEPRVQQQVVPLSAWAKAPPKTQAPPPAPPAGGQPAPTQPSAESVAAVKERLLAAIAAKRRERTRADAQA